MHLLESWGLDASAAGAREFGLRVVEAAAGRVGIVKPQVAFFERYRVRRLRRARGRARRGARGGTARDRRRQARRHRHRRWRAMPQAWLAPGLAARKPTPSRSARTSGPDSLRDTLTAAVTHGQGRRSCSPRRATPRPTRCRARAPSMSPPQDDQSVAARVARDVGWVNRSAAFAGGLGPIGTRVGATVDRVASRPARRRARGGAPILAPGFGAQGAEPADLHRLFGALAPDVVASESRSILSAGPDRDRRTHRRALRSAVSGATVADAIRPPTSTGSRHPVRRRGAARAREPEARRHDARHHPAGAAARRRGRTRLRRGHDARHRVPHQHPGDRRGQARPHPREPRHLAGQAPRRSRRPASAATCTAFLDERLPEPQPRPRPQQAHRARGTHRRRQGHGRRAHRSRDHPEIHLSVSATTRPPRPGRGRRRALPLRRRAPSSTGSIADGAAARVRHGAQLIPLRHAARAHRTRPRRRPARCCSRSTCRARARCATAEPVGDARVPAAAELGRTGRTGSSDAAPRTKRSARAACKHREGRARRPDASSTTSW